MRDAVVRTVVPFLVPLLIAWAAKIGLDLDVNETTMTVTFVVGVLYYALAKWIEDNVSAKAGQLLLSAGLSKRTPTYREPSRFP